MTLHVYAPRPLETLLRRKDCPTCERPSRMVVLTWEWYGPSVTCMRCGERWEDGEMMERPFAPRWRERSKEAARRAYRRHRMGVEG